VPLPLLRLLFAPALVATVSIVLPAALAQQLPIEAPSSIRVAGGIAWTVRAGNLMFAAVSINQSPPTWWLIDTGATTCELDLGTANRLKLKQSTRYRLTPNPKNRGQRFVFVEAPDLVVGTIQCGPLVMLAHPLVQALSESKSPRHWSGSFEKTGLLGMNLLAVKHAIIGWRKQQIYFDPGKAQIKSKADYEAEGYRSIPFNVTASRQVQIEGTLGSVHYQFCLDTGAPKTMIDQSVVDEDRLPYQMTNSIVKSPMKEFADSKVIQVMGTRFQLGDYDLSDRKILAASLHLTKSARGDVWAGLIGADILWDYDAVIDFGTDTLYLRR
jgi:predicted aspartyl protease